MRDMRILHLVAGLHPDAGGPSRTVVRLTDVLAEHSGTHVRLLSQSLRGAPEVRSRNLRVTRIGPKTGSHIVLKLGLPVRFGLTKALGENRPDLLHSHGIWHPVNHWVAKAARRQGVPLVIHPRGMLEPWALAYRGWRKQLAMTFYQRRDLETAVLLFATAEQEAENIRRVGLRQPIAVIPNGVDLPAGSVRVRMGIREQRRRNALFLSRIHPKKGLLNLLDAWANVRPRNWLLRLAGPDDGEHLVEVMRRVRDLGLSESVEYLGSVEGERKTTLFNEANLFILPSFSENFGVVVAEALAHGVPVITTYGTPWQGLETHACGWWVEPTVEGLAEALRAAVLREPDELREMGVRGRNYARQFDWSNIARQTAEVYRWILGQGNRPECVVLD